jgi:hypothetical protein
MSVGNPEDSTTLTGRIPMASVEANSSKGGAPHMNPVRFRQTGASGILSSARSRTGQAQLLWAVWAGWSFRQRRAALI